MCGSPGWRCEATETGGAASVYPLPPSKPMNLDHDEYMDLLKAQTLLLSRFKLNVSNEVSDFVGKDCLTRWLTNIFPVRCQTCGKPQGDEAFVSADGLLDDDKILLSLHHKRCRGSKTMPQHRLVMRTPTWCAAVEGVGDGESTFPLMVINPSCEQLLVQRVPAMECRNATLDVFTAIGFRQATGAYPDLISGMEARLAGDRLTVALTAALAGETSISVQSFTLSVPDGVRRAAQHNPFLAAAVTTKVLPTRLDALAPAFNDPEAVTARIPLRHL